MKAHALATAAVPPLMDALSESFAATPHAGALADLGLTVPAHAWRSALHGPLSEFLGRPGKQFRSQLARAAWELSGSTGNLPEPLEVLLEALHAGSLIVDDIEDGANLRRGRPSLHVLHGVPVALNAGNWLYFWALSQLERVGAPADRQLMAWQQVNRTLVRCHYGQALDVGVRVDALPQAEVASVANAVAVLKTGCLMELSATLAPLMAGAEPRVVNALGRFGRDLGQALQRLDDLGGITCPALAHKGLEDLSQGRVTWPWAVLATSLDEVTYRRIRQLSTATLRGEALPADLAEQMAHLLPDRARADVSHDLEQSLNRLEVEIGLHPALTTIRSEIKRLEKSYG